MTNDELSAEIVKLSQLMRQYVALSAKLAKQHDAKIKELQLEIQALRFSRDFEARMRADE